MAASATTMFAASRAAAGKLELVDLVKRYRDDAAAAVDGVSLTIESGEFLAVLGASGSGKSSLLMMIAGFTDATSGDIRLAGQSMLRLPAEARQLGVVFQNYALFSHLSVADNVGFPLDMRHVGRRERTQRIVEALETVGLRDLSERYPHELSGGQQQRVALARAMVFRPTMLLMDEPLGALDKQLRERMQLELRSIHRVSGATMLYVTHDQREALALADRVAVMRNGRFEQVAPPRELYEKPQNRFVASFVGDCNFLPVPDATRAGDGWDVTVLGRRGRVGGPGPAAGTAAVLSVRPHSLTIHPPSEDGLRGRVTDVLFLGPIVEYAVKLDGGLDLLVQRPANEHAAAGSPGQEVSLNWNWAEASLL